VIAVLTAVLYCLPTRAQDRDAANGEICYTGEFDRNERSEKRVTLYLDDPANPDDGGLPRLEMEQWGVPNILFSDLGIGCQSETDGTRYCSIDCDGGNLRYTRLPDGSLFVQLGHLMMGAALDSVLANRFDADGLGLDGSFVLAPQPPEACARRWTSSRAFTGEAVGMRAGDFSPTVEQVERSLAQLGHFAGAPDWYFSAETTAAVERFQRSVGFAETGLVDPATRRRLNVLQVVLGGC
jgi:hypothetical protein